MNCLVIIKQVPDTGMALRFEEGSLQEDSLKWVLSPYDEFALEEALKLKTLSSESKVFVMSLGPARTKESLMQALALGADEAFHLKLEKPLVDPLTIAKLLKKQIQSLEGDWPLVFCGKLASDSNNFAVPQMLAHELGRPFVSNVNKLEYKDDCFYLKRESLAGKEELLKSKAPLVLSADKGLNQPRYPSLPGIMKAKKKPFHEINLQEPTQLLNLVQLSLPPQKQAPQILTGSPSEQAQELVKLLKEKDKLL